MSALIREDITPVICTLNVSVSVSTGICGLNDSDWDSGISLQDSEHSQRWAAQIDALTLLSYTQHVYLTSHSADKRFIISASWDSQK